MIRIAAFAVLVLSLLSTACFRNYASTPGDYSRGAMPASRDKTLPATKVPAAPASASIQPPQPDERPIVPVAFGDPPKGIIGKIQERRQERKDDRKDKRDGDAAKLDEKKDKKPEAKDKKPDPKDEKPSLPSPFAKDQNKDQPNADIVTPMPKIIPAPVRDSADLAAVKKLHALAKQKWDAIPDYEARLTRREVIPGSKEQTEEMIFKFRKTPYSVYTKNTGTAGKGREVLYVDGPNAKMHIVTGEGDNRLVGAGFYTQMSPDDRMVTSKSRHKITEGAVGRTVELLGKAIAAAELGKFDGLKSLGSVSRKEYPYPLEGIEATVPPGQDPGLPKGGKREVYFDPNPKSSGYGLPVLIRTIEGDREVEYYCFTEIKAPANLTDADFDPKALQKKR